MIAGAVAKLIGWAGLTSRDASPAGTPRRDVVIRGRYDAAQTNDANSRHWNFADALSPDSSATAEVRATLRNRSRYEVANNPYAKGIVETIANDTIGTGPRLQIDAPGEEDPAREIERGFMAWLYAVCGPEKLRLLRRTGAESGEGFGLLVTNPAVPHPVKLDLRLIEADLVGSDLASVAASDDEVDGIVFDEYGNPQAYRIANVHPGDTSGRLVSEGFRDRLVPASNVIHYFREERPGQTRGVPEITPALPLFAQLRRFTLATLAAAETAANFAGILYTDAPAGGEADEVEPLDPIELEARALLTMPGGWRMEQLDAKQPTTAYGEFKRELLSEIARTLSVPYNVAAGDSSSHNFASGKLDHLVYYKAIRVERSRLERRILDRLLVEFLREAVLREGYFSEAAKGIAGIVAEDGQESPRHRWFWDGHGAVDPQKEAAAAVTRIDGMISTLAEEHAARGHHWEDVLRQRAKEEAFAKSLGLEIGQANATVAEGDVEENQP